MAKRSTTSAAKPRKGKLKLFRTEAGFHDAYVAATSRTAALEAWGASTDLFSAGAAAEVDDPELLKELGARPGEVVRRARGSAAEHVRALGKGKKGEKAKKAREAVNPREPAPRPSPSHRFAAGPVSGVNSAPHYSGHAGGMTGPKTLSRRERGKKPSRAAVDRGEAAVERAVAHREEELAALAREEEALAKRRRVAEAKLDKAIAAAERKRDAAREEYRAKLAEWDG